MDELQNESQNELLSRIDLIEAMVQEGRRGTEYWGWSFVLWGAAYLIAMAWSYASGAPQWAWPVTMTAAFVATIIVATRKTRAKPRRPISRAVSGVWIAAGIAIFVFSFAVSSSGHMEPHSYMAAIEIFLGLANLVSSIVLRWRVQFFIAILWWASAVATCFAPLKFVTPIFLADTFIGFLCFGLYLMIRERRDRRRREQRA